MSERVLSHDDDQPKAVVGSDVEQPTVQQRGLEVGAADDALEVEADRIAADVVQRLNDARRVDSPVAPGAFDSQRTQRSAAAPVRRSASTANRVQRREESHESGVGYEGGQLSGDLSQRIQRARQGGSALDPSTKSSMESAFGADFSSVSVHTGSESDQLNRSLNAKAFTVGSDIFFSGNTYSPGSETGRELLAHELAHTVQQGDAGVQRRTTSASGVTTTPVEVIQRLTVAGTRWEKTKKVNVFEQGGSGTVASFDDGRGAVIVKSNQAIGAEVAVAAGLFDAVDGGKQDGYSAGAPAVRVASKDEISTIRSVTDAKLKGDPRRFVAGLGQNMTLVMDRFDGDNVTKLMEKRHTKSKMFSKSRRIDSSSIIAQIANNPGPLKVLGHSAGVDIVMGMGDRYVREYNPDNFMFDPKRKRFGFVDNTENWEGGFLTTVIDAHLQKSDPRQGFHDWATTYGYVKQFAGNDIDGLSDAIYDNLVEGGFLWQMQKKKKDKHPDFQAVDDLCKQQAPQMRQWLKTGLINGRQSVITALQNPTGLVGGLSPDKQYDAVCNLVARRRFLEGDDEHLAWSRATGVAQNLYGARPDKDFTGDWMDVLNFFEEFSGLDPQVIESILHNHERMSGKVSYSMVYDFLRSEYVDMFGDTKPSWDKRIAAIAKASGLTVTDVNDLFPKG